MFGFFSVSRVRELFFSHLPITACVFFCGFFAISPKHLRKGLFMGKSHNETDHFLDEMHNWSRFGLACFGIENIKGWDLSIIVKKRLFKLRIATFNLNWKAKASSDIKVRLVLSVKETLFLNYLKHTFGISVLTVYWLTYMPVE